MGASEDLRSLVAPIVGAAGLELWDVELGRGVVRILVDRPAGHQPGPAGPEGLQHGVDLDTLSAVSRSLSLALDEHPEVSPAGHYQLEVSSPGLERTLRTPAHYRRFIGSQLAVKLRAPLLGMRRLRGVLTEAGDSAIRLATDAPAGDGRLDVPYSLIERARTVLQWGPAPRPGHQSSRASKRAKRPGRTGPSSQRPLSPETPLAPSPKDVP